jgi:citrate synthase
MTGVIAPDRHVVAGLDGVLACESAITLVDGDNGELFFRGYDVRDFADQADYLAVVQLLWSGHWPTPTEQAAFDQDVRTRRDLPAEVHAVLQLVPDRIANPMAALRTAVSLLGALDPNGDATSPATMVTQATTLLARMPTLVAALGRLQRGLPTIAPARELGHAANYLYMLRGTRPSVEEVAGLNTLMALHAEHELNASTFTARTVIGTLSDYYSAITAALGALKGPRHGGAIDAVLPMVRAIGSTEAVPAYVDRALGEKRKLPGFGHRVYRERDPRAALQAAVVQCLSTRCAEPALFEIARRLEAELFVRKRLPANVDYYAAVALDDLGFPPDLLTSFIASTRVAGWTAHILEQAADNRLIRPRALYRGPRRLPYPPPTTLSGAPSP